MPEAAHPRRWHGGAWNASTMKSKRVGEKVLLAIVSAGSIIAAVIIPFIFGIVNKPLYVGDKAQMLMDNAVQSARLRLMDDIMSDACSMDAVSSNNGLALSRSAN